MLGNDDFKDFLPVEEEAKTFLMTVANKWFENFKQIYNYYMCEVMN